MINRLHVKNFKSLRDLDLSFESFNVLIGQNEAGKSNILDAMALLKGLVRFSLLPNVAGDPIAIRGGFRDVVWNGEDKNPITLGVEGHLSGIKYEYTISIEFEVNSWVITDEILTLPPEQPIRLRSSPTKWTYQGSSGSINGNQLGLVRIQNDLAIAKQLSQSISTWSFYQLSTELMSHANDTKPVHRLDENGADLSAFFHTLLSERDQSLEAIEENVKAFSPDIEKIIAPINESNRTYIAVYERGLKRPIPAWSMSHGTLHLLGLAAALFGPDTADLIAFEEPDAYAHAHLLEVIGEMLQSASNKKQIIVTTQRPYLLDYLPRDSIIIVEKTKGATNSIRPKNKRKYLKAMKELGAGKAWYSGYIGGIP